MFSVSPYSYSVIYSEKICPLFWQILITGLKCSRVSFSPSSYNEKMRWRRGCIWTCFWFYLFLVYNFILCKEPFLRHTLVFGFHPWLFFYMIRMSVEFSTWRIVVSSPVIEIFRNSMQYSIWLNVETPLCIVCYYFFCNS